MQSKSLTRLSCARVGGPLPYPMGPPGPPATVTLGRLLASPSGANPDRYEAPPPRPRWPAPGGDLPWKILGYTDLFLPFPLLLPFEAELSVSTIALKDSASFKTELVSLPPSLASSAKSDVISPSFSWSTSGGG